MTTNTQDNDLMAQLRASGLMTDEPLNLAGLDDALEAVAEERIVEAVAAPEADDLSELEAQIAALDAAPSLEAVEIDASAIEQGVAQQEMAEEAYASQSSTVTLKEDGLDASTIDTTVEVTAIHPSVAAAKVKTPRAAKTGAATAKRVSRVAAHGTLGAFAAGLSGVAADQALIESLPVKIQEKAAGLVAFSAKGQKLSVFTQVGADLLRANGKLTMRDMVDTLNTGGGASKKPYSLGTARSQAQQVVSLFKRFEIIGADGAANRGNTRFSSLVAI